MDSKVFLKIVERVKTVAEIKTFLVVSVTAFDLSVMTWFVKTDQLVANVQLVNSKLKKGGNITLSIGKPVGQCKSIVSLNTLYPDTFTCIPGG